jgi:hypothetical protein
MVQTFIDDSSEDKAPALLVFAGYVASASRWKGLTDEWDACRLWHPQIEYFKMTEAMSFTEQFSRARGWTTKLRDERVCALYDIIGRYVEGAISSVLPVEPFKKIVAADQAVPRQQRNRWFFITYNIMHDMLRAGEDIFGFSDPIEFVFDEQSRGKDQIFNAWGSFKKHAPINPKLVAPMGGSPRFENDIGLPPLQAADFVAWVIRRKAARALRGEPAEPFFWEQGDRSYKRINRVWTVNELKEFVGRATRKRH